MSQNVTWNGTSRSIPDSGEINWAALTGFLVDLGTNAQTTNFQKMAVRIATSSPVTVSAANDCVIVTNLTVAGAVAVNLPAGSTKQMFVIVDGKGDAATNNITITPAAGTINGSASYVLNVNRAGVALIYNGSEWSVFADFDNSVSGVGSIPRNKLAAGSADHVIINDGSGYLSSEAQLSGTRGGTGVSNSGQLSWGSNNLTITLSGATSVTFPTSGTLATLAGAEPFSNKTISGASNTITNVSLTTGVTGTLPVANGGTGTTTSTGTGSTVLSNSPTLVTPALGTPSTAVLTNATGLPLTTGVTGTLPIGNGGTGQTTQTDAFDALAPTTTAGDIIYRNASDNVRLAAGTSSQVLHSGATPSWGAVSLTADVSGTLPISNGGTGQTTANPAFNALSPLTTKGDIVGYSTVNARVPIGSDGQILTADSTQTLGLKWATSTGSLDAPADAKNYSISCSVSGNALTIALKTKAGADPSSGDPVNIAFRNTTAATGDYSLVSATAATSVVISSGSTLGHTNGVAYPIYVYALNNAGTIELAASTIPFSELTTASTTAEGGAGAADSDSVLYSTSARTSKAIRLLARLVSTQTTAGTWAAVPTLVSTGNVLTRPNAYIKVTGNAGVGSESSNKITRFNTTDVSYGTAITFSNDATNGSSFTINEDGDYSISFTNIYNAAGVFGISLNASRTTAVDSLSVANVLQLTHITTASRYTNVSWTGPLRSGDVVRPHQDGTSTAATTTYVQFVIKQVSRAG